MFTKNFARTYEKNSNTWNIKCLVGDSFVQTNQQSSVLYYKLTDFMILCIFPKTSCPTRRVLKVCRL